MANPYVGEIKIFGGNFQITGWAFCQGQLIPISQNDVLFALIGTTYGGDGVNTFGLPDLRGRLPVCQGQSPGLTARTMGEKSGSPDVTLVVAQIPQHTHAAACSSASGNSSTPANSFWAANATSSLPQYSATANAAMNPGAVGIAGGDQPHSNMMPFLALNFMISLFGIFPTAN